MTPPHVPNSIRTTTVGVEPPAPTVHRGTDTQYPWGFNGCVLHRQWFAVQRGDRPVRKRVSGRVVAPHTPLPGADCSGSGDLYPGKRPSGKTTADNHRGLWMVGGNEYGDIIPAFAGSL